MEFYILLISAILGLFFLSYKFPNQENVISFILLIVLFLVGGFRDKVGSDYGFYTNWYINGTRDDGFEIGFLAIMKIFRYLNLECEFLFFFFSFFTYLFVYLAIKRISEEVSLSLILYFLIPVLFLCSFIYIRQSFSVAIAFYAFTFLINKEYFIYFLLMLIGCLFHYSCLIPLVCFLFVFLRGSYIKDFHLYILMGISFIISRIGVIYLISIFLKDSHYLHYVSSKAIPVPLLKLIVINLMGVLIISFFNKRGFQYDWQRYLLLIYVCSILFLNIFSESGELTRIYIYFRIFEIILVADIIRYALQKKRILLISFICCFYLFPFFRAIKIDSRGSLKDEFKLIPYKSLLLK